MKKYLSQYVAEAIGTFFLVFFGCGAIILSEIDPTFSPASIAIVFGAVVSIVIYAIGHISGAHINPAVTIAFWAIKKFPGQKVVGYVVAQVVGAIAASWVHCVIWGAQHSFGVTAIESGVGVGILVEVLLSFVLMFVIVSVATDARAVGELAGLAIGTTVAVCAWVGGPVTGASMNPARSLGPAVVSGSLDQLWLYVLMPVLGTVLGALIYEKIKCYSDYPEQHGCC